MERKLEFLKEELVKKASHLSKFFKSIKKLFLKKKIGLNNDNLKFLELLKKLQNSVMLLQTQVVMKKSNSLNNVTNNSEGSYSHYLKPIVKNTVNSPRIIQNNLKNENAKLYFSSINCLNWSANFCVNNGKENKSQQINNLHNNNNKLNDMSRTRSLFFKKPPYNNQKALSIKIIEKKSMNRISLFSNRCEDQIPTTIKRHCDFSDKLTYI